MTTPAVEAIDLVKKFGDTSPSTASASSVPEGTVLGLLGPNGAGKTTTVRMLTTLTGADQRHRAGSPATTWSPSPTRCAARWG